MYIVDDIVLGLHGYIGKKKYQGRCVVFTIIHGDTGLAGPRPLSSMRLLPPSTFMFTSF
jgi:hypothetical protein